jgi:hypothetical protein
MLITFIVHCLEKVIRPAPDSTLESEMAMRAYLKGIYAEKFYIASPKSGLPNICNSEIHTSINNNPQSTPEPTCSSVHPNQFLTF